MAEQEIERFPYGKRYWYPHMMPEDVAIWERFMLAYPDAYDECQYDVKVGKAPAFISESTDPVVLKQVVLYQRKIDVVGWLNGKPEVIELKPRAPAGAIGQVNSYGYLYARDLNGGIKPPVLILTDQIMAEMDELCDVAGVRIIAV